MPTKKKASRQARTHRADQRRQTLRASQSKGEFNKVVDVGKSLSSDKRTTAKKKVPKGQGDRGDTKG